MENERIRIENARNFVALGRDLGYTEPEIRRLAVYVDDKQEPIVHLIDQEKLLRVVTHETPSDGERELDFDDL